MLVLFRTGNKYCFHLKNLKKILFCFQYQYDILFTLFYLFSFIVYLTSRYIYTWKRATSTHKTIQLSVFICENKYTRLQIVLKRSTELVHYFHDFHLKIVLAPKWHSNCIVLSLNFRLFLCCDFNRQSILLRALSESSNHIM